MMPRRQRSLGTSLWPSSGTSATRVWGRTAQEVEAQSSLFLALHLIQLRISKPEAEGTTQARANLFKVPTVGASRISIGANGTLCHAIEDGDWHTRGSWKREITYPCVDWAGGSLAAPVLGVSFDAHVLIAAIWKCQSPLRRQHRGSQSQPRPEVCTDSHTSQRNLPLPRPRVMAPRGPRSTLGWSPPRPSRGRERPQPELSGQGQAVCPAGRCQICGLPRLQENIADASRCDSGSVFHWDFPQESHFWLNSPWPWTSRFAISPR